MKRIWLIATSKAASGRHIFVLFTLRERGGRMLLRAVKARASAEGIPCQRFIRMTLEHALLRRRKRAPTS